MIAKRIAWLAAAALLLALTLPAPDAAAQTGAEEYTGATAQGLALRRLGTTKRVLMIGAHPDDEDTQLLTALALGQGADVAYLSLTRGEGGQNGIGPELGEALGLIRSGRSPKRFARPAASRRAAAIRGSSGRTTTKAVIPTCTVLTRRAALCGGFGWRGRSWWIGKTWRRGRAKKVPACS